MRLPGEQGDCEISDDDWEQGLFHSVESTHGDAFAKVNE